MLRDGRLQGWFCVAVFGLGSLIATVALLPGATYLNLHQEGFTFSSMLRAHHVRWDEVAGSVVVHIGANQLVGWLYRRGAAAGAGVRLSLALAGCHAALPERYGLSARCWRGAWSCCAWRLARVMARPPWNCCSPRARALRASSR